jgi:hypothetical protein
MDAITAFLQTEIESSETVWVEMPIGYKNGDLACRLKKGLYGLKQSARLWARNVRTELKKLNYHPLESDDCIFLHPGLGIYIATHVDDFLLIGPSPQEISKLKAQLHEKFHMKDVGPCKLFLGVQITRDRANRTIHLSQTAYIDKILEVFGMTNAAGKSSPMEPNALKILVKNPGTATPAEAHLYQSMVGSSMYTMTQTRPELAFSVSFLSRFSINPSQAHIGAAKRVLRYLKQTRTLGITIRGLAKGDFRGYSDADWAGHPETRSSTSGYVFFLYGAPITWKTSRQHTIALSSTESEYYGLTNAAKEAIWFQTLLTELKYQGTEYIPTHIYGDNQGSLALAENPEFHQRTKHIDIKYHFIRQQVEKGTIHLSYISTADMIADGMTKPLTAVKHAHFIQQLGLTTAAQT